MSDYLFNVNAHQLRECLIEDLKVGLVPMVGSSPGLGKSDVIRQISDDFNMELFDMRVSQSDPVDMNGYPAEKNGRMTFRTPEYFPLETDPLPDGKDGWLIFFDEFNSGSKQTEAAAYKLLLDHAVYKYKLHPKCRFVAAGNLATDRAITNTQSTATTSRLIHYRLQYDHLIWIQWANAHDIDHRIISLIKFDPDIGHKFDPDTDELTFPCPRTWAFASKVINGRAAIDQITKIRLAGTVGQGAATTLATFIEIYADLPTIEQIMNNPGSGWTVPTEQSRQFAITTMLSQNTDATNIKKMITAIKRLPIEFQVITFKDIYNRKPELKRDPAIIKWIAENADVMF